jgi:hypothetical protein
MLKLENVTLILMTSVNLGGSVKALIHSSKGIEWGAIKLVSHEKPDNLPDAITHEFCPKMSNIDEWNYAAIYELPKHVDTEFSILIHDDGFVVNPESWRPEFLDYDYIGAPWPLPAANDKVSYRAIDGELIRVGNSVSLRSKRLLDLPIKIDLEWKSFHGFYNEDGFIAVNNRHIYKEHGMKFAYIDVAKHFSHENMIPEVSGIKSFAFHKHFGTNNIYPNYGR